MMNTIKKVFWYFDNKLATIIKQLKKVVKILKSKFKNTNESSIDVSKKYS